MNWLFMIPISIIGGVLFRHALTAEPKHKTRKTIQRDYFDIAPYEDPEQQHTPDDDTHSIILETVKKRWHKLTTWRHCDDFLSGWADVAAFGLAFFGLIALVRALQESAKSPYALHCSILAICISIAYWVGSWLKRHLKLLKDVRNRKYTCKLRPIEKPDCSADACLEVMETNAEDFADMTVYFDDGWYCASILLKINRHQA